jgi:hypothetical protein
VVAALLMLPKTTATGSDDGDNCLAIVEQYPLLTTVATGAGAAAGQFLVGVAGGAAAAVAPLFNNGGRGSDNGSEDSEGMTTLLISLPQSITMNVSNVFHSSQLCTDHVSSHFLLYHISYYSLLLYYYSPH